MTAPLRRLRLLDGFNNNRPTVATFNFLKGARTAQILGHTGLDAVIVDCEHGNIGDSDMHDQVSAIAGSGASPIIRVRDSTMPVMKRALDTGTHGIIVPMMNNAAQARDIVAYSKFPPVGIRGQGGPFACFEFGFATPAEYVAAANRLIIMIVQIETREGLENVEDIAQVDGVGKKNHAVVVRLSYVTDRADVLLIGPNDLALTLLGYAPAKGDEPVFVDAIDTILKACKTHNKKAGLVVPNGARARVARDRGFDFIALSADGRALQGWYASELAKL